MWSSTFLQVFKSCNSLWALGLQHGKLLWTSAAQKIGSTPPTPLCQSVILYFTHSLKLLLYVLRIFLHLEFFKNLNGNGTCLRCGLFCKFLLAFQELKPIVDMFHCIIVPDVFFIRKREREKVSQNPLSYMTAKETGWESGTAMSHMTAG